MKLGLRTLGGALAALLAGTALALAPMADAQTRKAPTRVQAPPTKGKAAPSKGQPAKAQPTKGPPPAAARPPAAAVPQVGGNPTSFEIDTDWKPAGDLPTILNASDVATYRSIFALQESGQWAAAQSDVGRLSDRLLMGHVGAQRLLSSTYRASYEEMAAWLSEFADHPDAPTIYALAVRRGPRGVETPQPSVMARHESYFTDRAVTSTWNQALASWRRGDYQGAAQLFEVVGSSTSETASGWTRSAGAFWAARANLLAGSPDRYLVWLRAAATQDHTFYGLLALRTLGATPYRSWNAAEWTSSRRALMRDSAGGRRALALLQVGVVQAAERELISIAVNNDNDAIVAALALAERAHLPAAALRMGYSILDRMGPEGRRRIEGLDNALYPVPRWRPQEGFVVDPALVWAFMRQESGFNPRARSRAGAMGLMQLMPGTARFVVRDFLPGREGTPPFQPDFNLSMGQQYLKHLTEVGVIGDNLLMIAAGYNGGPGNVARWGAGDDALLWVASVPLDETRGFIEVVTANYWTYQMRLGQPLTSLEELAAHRWPQYRPGGQRAAAN